MKHNWTNLILGIAATAALAIQPAWGAQVKVEKDQLQSMAREADTVAEHAAVAQQYRLHAEEYQAEAEKLEATVTKMTKSRGAMARKWPAMSSQRYKNAKRDAIDARRAAQENLALADHHIRMAVEAQGATAVASQDAAGPEASELVAE